ncbi:15294_t:CDS:2, partial [Acaulospora morrowiae]
MAEKIPTILIIGAGPGGLALYHSIQKNLNQPEKKFNVRIFERERSLARYNISINKNGIVALLDCLPNSLLARLPEAIPNPIPGEYHAFTATDETGNFLLHEPSKQVKSLFELPGSNNNLSVLVSYRNKLRDLLLEDVNVEWNKKCIGYEEVDDGVWAIFNDGSKVFGNFLVASDGINSPIRKKKVPELKVMDLGATFVVVDIAPSKKLVDELMKYYDNNLVLQSLGPNGDSVFALFRRIPIESNIVNKSDDEIHYRMSLYYIYNTDFRMEGVNLNYDVDDDNSESLVNHVIERIEKYRPPCELRDLIIKLWKCVPLTTLENYPYKDYNAPIRRQMRDLDPLSVKPWETTRVTLLGDAAHAMNLVLGFGANRALCDAALLTEKLRNFEKYGWKECFKQYEHEMRINASKDVLVSRGLVLSQNVPK